MRGIVDDAIFLEKIGDVKKQMGIRDEDYAGFRLQTTANLGKGVSEVSSECVQNRIGKVHSILAIFNVS